MVDLDLVAGLTERVRDDGFCLITGIIPAEEIEQVRRGFLRARDAHREAVQEHPGMVQPASTTKAIETGLAQIQETLIDPTTSRTQAIALVDELAQKLRAQGIVAFNEPTNPEAGPPPLPTHEIAYFPEFSKYIAHPLLLTLVRNILDPHTRVYQVEFGKTIQGAVAQPFPNVCMSLVTVWYLTDVDANSAGTWVLPGSHRDTRNPRGPNDGIDPGKPIPGEFQVTAPAGSVLVQDTRMWHSMAANPSDQDRVGCVVRYAPWWLNSNGALTSQRLTPRPVPRATYDTLHPDAKPLFRHVTEGMDDEMAMEKQLWTLRAGWHTAHKAGLTTCPENNDHVVEYINHSKRVLAQMLAGQGTLNARL